MATVTHPDISTSFIKTTLENSTTLMEMEIGGRALQGVFYLDSVPQDEDNPYPNILIEAPYQGPLAQVMRPNGPHVRQSTHMHDVIVQARDVEPLDDGMRAVRAKIIELLAGQNANVTGGRVNSCRIADYPPDQRIDKGAYIYSRIGVTFAVDAQVT